MNHPLSRSECRLKSGQRFHVDGEEFELGARIGDGAVGLVRKAIRKKDQMLRAVKFLAPDPKYIEESSFDDVASRFRREGLRGAKLDHPNLVRVYAYEDNENGTAFVENGPSNPFILMEYVDGRSLESYIMKLRESERGTFLPTQERLQIAIQVVRALDYLHSKAIVHRDVKPANIFVSSSLNPRISRNARLGDFGVVKWGDFHASVATGTLTVTSQKGLGTLKYMAPEQALVPKDVTVRADIFSLGITLFELFTGRILPGPHHVFQIMSARLSRGNTASRFFELGYRLGFGYEDIAALLLDMHLRGVTGRPAINRVLGLLKYAYNRIFDEDFPE